MQIKPTSFERKLAAVLAWSLLLAYSGCTTRMLSRRSPFPINTQVGTVELRTTVDSPEAKYYLEQYRMGVRSAPSFDCTINNIKRELTRSCNLGSDCDRLVDANSYDLVASVLGDVLTERSLEKEPALFDLLDYRTAQICNKGVATYSSAGEFIPCAKPPLVVFVPGAFHQSDKGLRKDTEKFMRLAEQLGVDVIHVPTEELGVVEENLLLVERAIHQALCTGREFMIMSLSRGSAEVHLALTRLEKTHDLSRLHTWLSVSGIPRGSPIADKMSSFPRAWITNIYLKRKDIGTIEGIRSMSVSHLKPQIPCRTIPKHVRVICVVPIMLTGNIKKDTRRRFQYMDSMGPNDAIGLCTDALLPGCLTIPIVGSDHKFTEMETDCMGLSFVFVAQDLHDLHRGEPANESDF